MWAYVTSVTRVLPVHLVGRTRSWNDVLSYYIISVTRGFPKISLKPPSRSMFMLSVRIELLSNYKKKYDRVFCEILRKHALFYDV